jgi:hypothetical protein
MRALMLMLGLPDLPLEQLLIVLALVAIFFLMMGWIADMALRDSGYGVLLNGALMLAGAIGGVLLWRKLGFRVSIHPQLASVIVAGVSGIVVLLSCAISRRFL